MTSHQHQLEKEIQKARPKLKVVSPLAHWIILIFAIFNVFLGVSFFFALDAHRVSAPLLIVNDILTYKFWGVVFIAVGLVKLFSLWTNNWALARQSLFVGVSIKAIWMVALIIRTFVSPGTVFLCLMWVALALMQIGTYIWFMPPSTESYKEQRRKERIDG